MSAAAQGLGTYFNGGARPYLFYPLLLHLVVDSILWIFFSTILTRREEIIFCTGITVAAPLLPEVQDHSGGFRVYHHSVQDSFFL